MPDLGRVFHSELVIRDAEDGTDGRTLYGTVVPYGEVARVDDGLGAYDEMFAPGAFTRSLAQRSDKVKLFTQHDRSRLPIGRLVDYDEHDRGLDAAFFIPEHTAGDDVLSLVREGVVDSFSVGFRGIKDHDDNGVKVRTEAAIGEVSVVHSPAYAGAALAGIRSKIETLDSDEFAEWIEGLPNVTRTALEVALRSTPPHEEHGAPDEAPPDNRHGTQRKEARARRLAMLQLSPQEETS